MLHKEIIMKAIRAMIVAIILVITLIVPELVYAHWVVRIDNQTFMVKEFRVVNNKLYMITDTQAYDLNIRNMAKKYDPYTLWRNLTTNNDHNAIKLQVVPRNMSMFGAPSSSGQNGYMLICVYMTGKSPITPVFNKKDIRDIVTVVFTFDGGTYHLTDDKFRQYINQYPDRDMDFNKNLAKYGQQALVNSAVFR